MSTQVSRFSRSRLMVDVFLLFAVIVALLAYRMPGNVSAGQNPQAQIATSDSYQDLGQPYPADFEDVENDTISSTVILDDNTLAALLAAENTALTPPQYLISLPAITR